MSDTPQPSRWIPRVGTPTSTNARRKLRICERRANAAGHRLSGRHPRRSNEAHEAFVMLIEASQKSNRRILDVALVMVQAESQREG
jgi:hypothetical protein